MRNMWRRVIVQEFTESKSSKGEDVKSWSQLLEERARIVPLGGKETFVADQVQEESDYAIIVRHNAAITGKHRILIPTQQTILVGDITDAGLTITVASATGFPLTGNYRIRIGDEIVLVRGGNGTTTWYPCNRGTDSTTAAAHSAGDKVWHMQPLDIEVPTDVDNRERWLEILGRLS